MKEVYYQPQYVPRLHLCYLDAKSLDASPSRIELPTEIRDCLGYGDREAIGEIDCLVG